MNEKKHLPLIKKQGNHFSGDRTQNGEVGKDTAAANHVGTPDAFSQTESTASPDADNVSDEKLDEMLNED